MQYEWDEVKRQSNAQKHGIDFQEVEVFDWDSALVERSDRAGEVRFVAIGYIDVRLCCFVFTEARDTDSSDQSASASRRETYMPKLKRAT